MSESPTRRYGCHCPPDEGRRLARALGYVAALALIVAAGYVAVLLAARP